MAAARSPSRFQAFRQETLRFRSVGRTGNDLHYRGYDIKDLATHCEFEEVAYLLIHGKLPNQSELSCL